ncbi:MAG: hypothetical protein IPM26_07205 [Saprospiraceae bacterium]|nr:hypothetical protein [Saprospiraceae bacterium]
MSDFTFDKKNYFGKGAEGWLLAIGITLLSIGFNSTEAVAQTDRYVSTTGVNAGDCSDPMNPCLTIQYAISQSLAGDNVHVGAGTYNENLSVDRSLSFFGGGMANVIGSDVSPGTFHILPAINNVLIDGFIIVGFDSPNPAIERAAIYLQGNHTNITIQNNTVTAAGEAGYLEEFGAMNVNVTISNNIFNGQTFVGPMPAGCGFSMQFTLHNVPRQLVVVSNNSSNVIFTNNIISGTTGGPSTEPGCTVTGQGNNLVTIDATNVTISGNTFNGTMYGSSSMLRARGTQVSVSGNTFDGSNLNGSTYYIFFDNDALAGGTPSTVAGVVGANTFLPAAAHVTSGTNFLVISCTGPILNTSINGFVSNETGNDGINDTVSYSVCNVPLNILFNSFTDVFSPALPNVRVYQIRETSNLTVPFCNNCSAVPSAFTGATGTAALINPALPGTLTFKFFAFSDANGNTTYETSECRGDTVVYIITVNPIPQLTAQTPSICPSQNPFNLTSLQSSITSATGTFTYSIGGSPIMNPAAFNANNGDVVNVTFTDANGCTNTTTITFTLLNAPPVSILPFAGNPFTQVCVGREARFLASATAAGPPAVQSYMWTFSGSPVLNNYGQTAVDGTRRNRGAIYNNAAIGPQTVNLTVIYTNGCSVTAPQHTINVLPLPVLTAQTPAICINENPFDLTSLEASITSATGTFSYSFGGSPVADPTMFTAANGDVVDVNFTDSNGCSNTTTITFTVNPLPVLTAQTPSICPSENPFDLTSLESSITSATGSFAYEFGGNPVMDPTAFTAADGNVVNVTFTDGNGCSSTTTITFTLLDAPAVTILPFMGNPFTQVCVGVEARFLASATAAGPPAVQSYMWTFSGSPVLNNYGQTAVDGTRRNRGAIYNNAAVGPQTVNLTVIYTNGCSVTAPQHTINVLPLPVLTAQTPAICINENPFDLTSLEASITSATGTFSYSFGGSPVADPTMFTAANGDVVDVNFTDGNGCSNTTTITFTVNPLPVLTAQTPSICPSDNPFDLTSLESSITSATGTFAYEFGGNPVMDPTAFTAADGNVVNVTFTDGNGCSSTTTITFTLLPEPPVTILPFMGNPFTRVCVGVEARFLASPTAAGPPAVQSYMWTFSGSPTLGNYGQTAGDGTRRNRGAIYNNAAVGPQTVNLTVIYANGCTSTAPTHTIIVNPLPIVTCPADTIVCEDAGNIDLTTLVPAASPAGGTFAGTYVISGNLFNTSSAGVGTHAVRYRYTDINGCVDSCAFNIIVYDIPSAPQLNKVPNVTFACTGDILSAVVLTPGTGGSGSCEDQYRFSTDNGMTWSSWSTTIPSFSAVTGVNIIEARRFCNTNRCPSDITSISWNVNAPITAVNISVVPAGDVCLGATGVQYTANVTGGTGPFTYAWCAYNSGDGSGTCFGGFSPGGSNPIHTRNWTATTGPKSVGVTVSQEGCPNATALYSFNVVGDPVRPSLATASPTTSYACRGANVSATFNAGTGGTGSCTDEYRFSTDNGATWSAYVPGSMITMGAQTVLIQTRRVCDGLGCDGAGEVFATVVSWTSSALPTPSIVPDPAEVCAGVDLQLDGNPSGGTGTYDTHLWTGPGAAFVEPDNEQVTVFNTSAAGVYDLTYTVTDNNGCIGTDAIQITVFPLPTVTCPADTIVCEDADRIDLTTLVPAANPAGGTFIGLNVSGGFFDVDGAGVGSYEIIYEYEDINGCTNTCTFNITVFDIPSAPQLNKVPNVTFACTGDLLSAVVITPGTGGSGSCEDQYRFSTDNGMTWSSWSATIPSFSAVAGVNIIEARRFCNTNRCPSDITSISWNVNAPITAVNISVAPTGDVCLGATGVQYTANVTGGTGPFTYAWCAYDSGDGSGTCFGGFSPGGSNPIQTRNWVATTGPKSVGVTVSQEGCPNATALYSFNVVADPVRPSLATASPTTSYACRGANVSATFNAGTGGTGSCTDEYRFSTDNGATWSAYVPGSMITMGTQTVLIQTRRVCDGPGCDGAGENLRPWSAGHQVHCPQLP